ncbi:MAG: ADP-dependent glucokinase/phosphofructokinase [Lachnospiraceae bacterium]|nr:ADP-dependent glucokinase/phosphofructokinase [Lachnospiraceae bacterium]
MNDDFSIKYSQAFENLENDIKCRKENGKITAMGYTSNLDLICDFDVERLNELLKLHWKYDPDRELKPAKLIKTTEELLETIVYFCINGIGGEVDIENTDELLGLFEFKKGMGGTCVQAALALAEIGAESLVHLTDDSKEVCELLDSPYVYVAGDNGKLVHSLELRQHNDQELHCIIQFQKGGIVRIADKEWEIPTSNRLILTKITVNETVPFDERYFNWIEKNADRVSSNLLSSFNCIADKNVVKERLDYLAGHVKRYHERNPDGIVFYEDAHYHSKEIREMVLKEVYPMSDIVSMNEEELAYTVKELYEEKLDKEDISSCIDAVRRLINDLHVKKGIVVHTKDYGVYIGKTLPIDIESGIMYGNIIATAKAINGWYGTKEQIKEVIKLEMSPKGLKYKKEIEEKEYAEEIIMVPSRYVDRPKYTIGLGDSFVGGLQMCF